MYSCVTRRPVVGSLPVDAMTMQEVDFRGSFGMPPVRYDELFRLIERGTLDPGLIVGETLSLDDLPETLASMDDYETVGIPVVTAF